MLYDMLWNDSMYDIVGLLDLQVDYFVLNLSSSRNILRKK